MKALWTSLRWIVLSLGVLAILGIAALAIYTHTPGFRELLRREMIAAVNGSIRGQLEIERLEGSVWSSLTLHGVRFRHDGTDILEVPRLRLGYSLIPLLWGRVQIFVFEGFQPVVRLAQDEDGIWNITEAIAPKEQEEEDESDQPSSFVVLLNSVVLHDAAIDLTVGDKERQTYRFRDADLDAQMGIRPAGVELEARRLASRLITENLPEVNVAGSVSYQDTASPATLEIGDLELRSGNSLVRASGKITDLAALAVEAKILLEKAAPTDVAKFFPQWPLRKDLHGTLDVRGTPGALRGNLALAAGGGKVTGDFQADLESESPRYAGTFKIAEFPIGNALETAAFDGVLSGTLEASGSGTSFADLNGKASLNVQSVAVEDWRLGEISLSARLQKSLLEMDGELSGEMGGAVWQGEIALSDKPGYDLVLAVQDLNIQKASSLTGKEPVEGRLNFKGTLQGTGLDLTAMDAKVKLQFLPSTIGPLDVDHGTVAATVRNGIIRFSQLTISAAQSSLTARGEIGVDQSYRGNVDYQLRVRDLSPWLELVDQEGSGGLEVSGRARGNLAQLESRGRARIASLRYQDIQVRQGDVNFNLSGLAGKSLPRGAVSARFAGLQAGGIALQTAEVSVKLPGGEPPALLLDLKARDGQASTHAAQAEIHLLPEEIRARVSQISLDLPDGTWKLSQPATLSRRQDDFFIERLSLQNRARQLFIDGRFSLKGSQSLSLSLTGFPLQALDAFLPEGPDLTGRLSARAQISGTAASPEIAGTVELAEGTIAGEPYGGFAATILYRQKAARVDATLRQDKSHVLTAAGTVPLELSWSDGWRAQVSGALDFRLHSEGLRLDVLNAFIGEFASDVTGEAALDLSARGTFKQPVLKGTFQIREGGLAISPLGIKVSSVTLDGAMDGQNIKIGRLAARSQEGRLNASGSIALREYRPENFRISVTGNRWPVIATSRYQSLVDAKLMLEGSLLAPRVSGNVDVLEATLRPDLDFLQRSETPIKRDETIVIVRGPSGESPEVKTPEAQSAAESDVYQNLRMDVSVALVRNVRLLHRNANAELSGKLRARKEAEENLALIGAIDVVRGWVAFQGRRFTLTRGRVLFTGGETITPSLDVVAQYRLRDYLVEVVLTGTAEKPELTLRSRPQLDQADILALLLFGKPTSALNRSEQFSLQQSAIDLTAGYAAGRVAAAVSRALGLEKLGVDISDIDFSGGRIGIGRYVTPDAYLSFSQELAGERGREIAIEYELVPNWKLRATTDPDGGSGVDVLWHKRY